eukprot:gene8106-3696_t
MGQWPPGHHRGAALRAGGAVSRRATGAKGTAKSMTPGHLRGSPFDWGHYAFAVDDPAQPWWEPADFVDTDGRPRIAYPSPARAAGGVEEGTGGGADVADPGELPWFDMALGDDERAAALRGAVAELRARPNSDGGRDEELGLLLMGLRGAGVGTATDDELAAAYAAAADGGAGGEQF